MGRTWRIRADDLDALVEPDRTAAGRKGRQEAGQERDDSAPPIWEWMSEVFRDIPEEELDRVPKDAMENLDHYVYGTPGRDGRP